MVRASAALFIPAAESLLLVLIFYFAASALMDQTMQSDFSPAMRSVLLSQLLLTLLTTTIHLIVAIVDKSHLVLPDAKYGGDQPVEEGTDVHRRNLAMLISQRTDYRFVMLRNLCLFQILTGLAV